MGVVAEKTEIKTKRVVKVYIYRGWVHIQVWNGNPGFAGFGDRDAELVEEHHIAASYVNIKHKPQLTIYIAANGFKMMFMQDNSTKIDVYDKTVDYIECSTSY